MLNGCGKMSWISYGLDRKVDTTPRPVNCVPSILHTVAFLVIDRVEASSSPIT